MGKTGIKENLRTYHVDFMFPQLKGGGIYQSARVQASGIDVAISRAFKEVRKGPAFHKRRIRIDQLKVTAVELGATDDGV